MAFHNQQYFVILKSMGNKQTLQKIKNKINVMNSKLITSTGFTLINPKVVMTEFTKLHLLPTYGLRAHRGDGYINYKLIQLLKYFST